MWQRRLQIGAAELRYAVAGCLSVVSTGPEVTRQRDALGLLRSEDERSMTQKLQALKYLEAVESTSF